MTKLKNTGTSIFSIMSKMSHQYKAINLAQGFPDFNIAPRLIEIAKNSISKNIHQYTPMTGLPSLLDKIINITYRHYKRKVSASLNVLITAGATQGIYTTVNALVKQGDEVIILDPSYDNYEPSVLVAGGVPVRISLDDDYSPNFNKIEDAITLKTKMIIINNPHNPTGKIWNESDFNFLELLLDKYPNILLLSDEVYEYISFEHKHISVNTRPKLVDKAIIVSSFGKSLHITGWKIGYLIAQENIMNEIKKVHQFLVFSISSTSQYILSEYLDDVEFSDIAIMYEKKRLLFRENLKDSRFKLLPSEGTYFQLLGYREISSKKDTEFAKDLIKKFGIATIPISVFYKNKTDNKTLRLCFAKTDKTLTAAADILSSI